MAILAWKIGLLSTDYDLRSTRRRVIKLIERLGFEPVAFERPDMRVEPRVHSHEACVAAIPISDIFVLMIDRRSGGLYCGTGDLTVTEEEFSRAYELEKLIIPCVTEAAFNDRHEMKKKVARFIKRHGVSKEVARERIEPGYVDDWAALDFLERVCRRDRDQYLIIFKSESELLEKIEGRLEGFSRYICNQLSVAQSQQLDSTRSTSALFESVGMQAYAPLFVAPPYQIKAGRSRGRTACGVLRRLQSDDAGILVTGDPGVGKTVLLAKGFKEHVGLATAERSYRLPFFVSLRGAGASYHFDIDRYLQESFRASLKKDPYPSLTLRDIRPVFYIDGLDESGVVARPDDTECLGGKEMFQHPFAVTCRTGFAQEMLDTSVSFGSQVAVHLHLQAWGRAQADRYICGWKQHRPDTTLWRGVRQVVTGLPAEHPVPQSALLLSLLVWLVLVEPDMLKQELKPPLLFRWFLDKWAVREAARHGLRGTCPEEFLHAWTRAGWLIHKHRHGGKLVSRAELLRQLGQWDVRGEIATSAAFASLLTFGDLGNRVTGAIHEQFLDYLVASSFVEGCAGGHPAFPKYLENPMSFDINRFIKAIWAETPDALLRVTLDRLKTAFLNTLGRSTRGAKHARANCVYYISRVPLQGHARRVLEELLPSCREAYTRDGVRFGLVRLGDRQKERELFASFTGDADADAINRRLHLVYFKDLPTNVFWQSADTKPKDWSRTLAGMMGHIESTEERFVNSRRIDIYTVRRLLESDAACGPVTEVHLRRMEKAVNQAEAVGQITGKYRDAVRQEMELLRAAFEKKRRKRR